MNDLASVRQHIVNLLTKAEAHLDARNELKDFPRKLRGSRPEGAPHTPWQLLEHMRLAQWDILRFSVDASHVSPKWPEGYWPENDSPPSDKAWEKSVRQFLSDQAAMVKLVRDPKRDLLAPIPHGIGQTLLREALLVADHNAYHLGQIVMVRRILQGR
ncbi:MAG TPA: DinB family protein [Candidatus Angelobacter sp.]|nr:DinB family protein [Candidatus Angelobacter sp.]